ncbi:MAG: MOSC domain-containing protein [Terriglobia bacterium]
MNSQIQPGRVASINLSNGGAPKAAVAEALITATGVRGDRQQDLRYHGGPDRAVLIYSVELIHALQREGHPIRSGSTGENLTVSGLEWDSIVPGVELWAGGVRLQVTKYATPCYKISGSFLGGELSRISQKLRPGWSRVCARVLTPGTVRVGDPVEVIER